MGGEAGGLCPALVGGAWSLGRAFGTEGVDDIRPRTVFVVTLPPRSPPGWGFGVCAFGAEGEHTMPPLPFCCDSPQVGWWRCGFFPDGGRMFLGQLGKPSAVDPLCLPLGLIAIPG